MNLSDMILHVLQFASDAISPDEIARRIAQEFGESVSPEAVQESILSVLLPASRVVGTAESYRIAPDNNSGAPSSNRPTNEGIWASLLGQDFDECERTVVLNQLLATGEVDLRFAYRSHRLHFRQCDKCRNNVPGLNQAFLNRDEELLEEIRNVLNRFELRPSDGVLEKAAFHACVVEYGAEGFEDDQVSVVSEYLWMVTSWRNLMLGAKIAEQIREYTETLAEPDWIRWRLGLGDIQAVTWVSGLSKEDFAKVLLADDCLPMFRSSRINELNIDALLEFFEIMSWIGPEYSYDQFADLFGPVLQVCDAGVIEGDSLLAKLLALALARCEGAQASKGTSDTGGITEILSDIKDRVDSNNALQIPIIDLLEHIAKSLDSPARKASENSLRAALGGTYSLLCPDAQTSLIAAEQLSTYRELADASLVIVEMAKAFELQLRASFVGPLCEFLKGKGFGRYPVGSDTLGSLLISGRINDRLMLGQLATILEHKLPEVQEFASSRGLQLNSVIRTIRDVAGEAGRAKHKHIHSDSLAAEIKRRWICGEPFKPGIFTVLLNPVGSLEPDGGTVASN